MPDVFNKIKELKEKHTFESISVMHKQIFSIN